MATMLIQLDEDAFLEQYVPIQRENEAGIWEHAETLAYPQRQVWSIYENLDNDTLYALPGYHIVNIIGYVVTEKPWEYKDIEAIWMLPMHYYAHPDDSRWIYLERQYGKDLMVGPYPTSEGAEHAMNNALLLDALCEEDCLECYITTDKPNLSDMDIVEVNLDDPDHTGVGERDNDAVLTLLSYDIISHDKT